MTHTTLCLLLLANILTTAFAGDRIEQTLRSLKSSVTKTKIPGNHELKYGN
jgi:hypothetical protein